MVINGFHIISDKSDKLSANKLTLTCGFEMILLSAGDTAINQKEAKNDYQCLPR
jgi:hypothetical protein